MTTLNTIEGEALHLKLHAHGNPMAMTYTWTKDGLPILSSFAASNSGGTIMSNTLGQASPQQRILSDGPELNISKVSRHDAGTYICEVMNSQGSAVMEVQVIVECKYEINRN